MDCIPSELWTLRHKNNDQLSVEKFIANIVGRWFNGANSYTGTFSIMDILVLLKKTATISKQSWQCSYCKGNISFKGYSISIDAKYKQLVIIEKRNISKKNPDKNKKMIANITSLHLGPFDFQKPSWPRFFVEVLWFVLVLHHHFLCQLKKFCALILKHIFESKMTETQRWGLRGHTRWNRKPPMSRWVIS